VVGLFHAAANGLMSKTLETFELTKSFGAVAAASNISVAIEEGSIVGMIGGNGAGKTTFLNLITGHLRPSHGAIHYQGRDITGALPRRVAQLGISRSFQVPQIFGSLTTYENLLIGTGIAASHLFGRGMAAGPHRDPRRTAEDLLVRFGLAAHRDSKAGTLPQGLRKLLDIAMTLVVQPKLLLLDEPTSGVSADEKFGVMEVVFEAIRGRPVAVLFVEHDIEVVQRYARRVLAFCEGRIIADGPPDDVFTHPDVRRLVIGEAPAAGPASRTQRC
jgi:branched-chain amino acid transport system ATP-binding protein